MGISNAVICNLASFAYMFMILAQMVSAGLITLIYPFAVFGYALIEECRPGKQFWQFMIKYTLVILFFKYLL